MRSLRSNSVTWWPALFSCAAAAIPAGPEPITATVRPVRNDGGSGFTHTFSKAWSMIRCSICLIVTASSLMSSTQAASHGAGQIRPVNSGKLLVACRASIASRQRSRKTRSFQSGIRFPSGQPEWQNGMPQSMQRAPCSRSPSTASGSWYSAKSFTRSSIGRLRGVTRSSFRKPPSSPIEREHLLLGLGLDLGALRGVAAILLGLLAGALGCPRGVLLLARLARLVGLLVAAVADRVRLALARAHRRRAVPLLGDHRVVARVDVPALGLLAQRALVVHRHDLHELRLRCLPLVEHAPAHRRA